MGARFYPNHRRLLIRLECSTSNAGNPEQLDGFVIAQARTHTQTQAFEHGKRSRVPRIVVCEGNQTNDRQKKVKSLGAPMTKSLGCLNGWVFPQVPQIAKPPMTQHPRAHKGFSTKYPLLGVRSKQYRSPRSIIPCSAQSAVAEYSHGFLLIPFPGSLKGALRRVGKLQPLRAHPSMEQEVHLRERTQTRYLGTKECTQVGVNTAHTLHSDRKHALQAAHLPGPFA